MRTIVHAGFCVALVAGAAQAQVAPPPPAPNPAAAPDAGLPSPSLGPDTGAPPRLPSRGPGEQVDEADPPPPPHGAPRRPPPPPLSRAARFRFAHGNVEIDIKCADDEPTKVCTDNTLQLIERLGWAHP